MPRSRTLGYARAQGEACKPSDMPVTNDEIAESFERCAALLEIEGANAFRVRAYRTAARTLRNLTQSAASLLRAGEDLSELPGIGKDLAGKIRELAETGHLSLLAELEGRMPGELAQLVALPGLGPKRVKALHDRLKIGSVEDLRRAAAAGRLCRLPGFGRKTEEKILHAIARRQAIGQRIKLATAEQVAAPLLDHLKAVPGVKEAVIAGSFRRRQETVGDLDILVTCSRSAPVMQRFTGYEDVAEVVSQGTTRATVRLRSGLQVDLRVVPRTGYGAALHYFTGSKAHNIAVRAIAVKKGLKLNEYGLFKGARRVAGKTEAEVFKHLGLPYIEPELRQDRGEIAAARTKRLPQLVTLADIRGDLHCHTDATDGRNTLREMAEAAKARGYAYLAISDHTRHRTVAHGLTAKRLAHQIEQIDRLNEKLEGIRILKASEVDILEDGRLDLPDSILERLDLTVCAVHFKFNLTADRQTERVLRAMDNRHFNILAHPTGRLLGQREAYPFDMERVLHGALERGCYLEVNGQPERLDLTDVHCRMAKEMGLKVAISTDAHTTSTLDYMRYGLDAARRGWLEPDDVLNTRGWGDLKKLLKRS